MRVSKVRKMSSDDVEMFFPTVPALTWNEFQRVGAAIIDLIGSIICKKEESCVH